MGTGHKTITLTDQQDLWVQAQIQAGRYANASECISDLIRLEQERREDIEAIRSELIEGETSGEARAFDPASFKRRMHINDG